MKCRWCNGLYDPRLWAEHGKTLRHRIWLRIAQILGSA